MASFLPSLAKIGGPFFSGAASVLGSVLSKSSADKNIRIQQQENEKNRRFNSQEAQKQRDYSSTMWHLQNQYNSPLATMERLKAAGIHPALAYSSGQTMGALTPLTGSSGSYNGGVSPTMPDYSGISNAGTAASESVRSLSDAQHSRALAGLTDKEIKWYDELAKGKVDTMWVNIQVGDSISRLNDENRALVVKQLGYFDEQMNQCLDLMNSAAALNDENTGMLRYKNLEEFYKSAFYEEFADIYRKKLQAELKITWEQAVAAEKWWTAQIFAKQAAGRDHSERAEAQKMLNNATDDAGKKLWPKAHYRRMNAESAKFESDAAYNDWYMDGYYTREFVGTMRDISTVGAQTLGTYLSKKPVVGNFESRTESFSEKGGYRVTTTKGRKY